jgi:hypothetical protein
MVLMHFSALKIYKFILNALNAYYNPKVTYYVISYTSISKNIQTQSTEVHTTYFHTRASKIKHKIGTLYSIGVHSFSKIVFANVHTSVSLKSTVSTLTALQATRCIVRKSSTSLTIHHIESCS